MIISDEQVKRALEYLHANGAAAPTEMYDCLHPGISPELVERVRSQVAGSPEMRDDRVAEGRALIASGISGDQVATKMIGRIISDSLR